MEQHLTCSLKINDQTVLVSAVYAKCKTQQREALWSSLRAIDPGGQVPWLVGGDFNCILSPEEKKGGSVYSMSKSLPFIDFIMDCGLTDIGYSGSTFTWCNGWAPKRRVWERLDRVLVNDSWLQQYSKTTNTHLVRSGSDHAPLNISVCFEQLTPQKLFKFLDLWTKEPTFLAIVQQAWDINVSGSPMWRFHQKMKNTCSRLSDWSRNCVGNIFDKTAELEKEVATLEQLCVDCNTEQSRTALNECNARLVKHYKTEEAFWRQKSGIKWHAEGDLNTWFFHSVMASKRRRLMLTKIRKPDGTWVQGNKDISEEAIRYFGDLFSQDDQQRDLSIVDLLPRKVTQQQNDELAQMPTLQEVKSAVFAMSSHNAPGPDGMSGLFYTHCWEIIGQDVFEMVLDFFSGSNIPKFLSHTCLVLLPKTEHPQQFSEFRPISLSNFSCKIISKILNDRLAPLLPAIISHNQTGFIKGRSIHESVALAQELIHNMKPANKNSNVVLKLDMAKAYDRVSWPFLCQVLRQLGFSEFWIDMVWRILSNVWYSVNINGSRFGFFKSSRGLKQGDPLSPSLFVLGSELLSVLMDQLLNEPFIPFSVHNSCPKITHLCYADDTILFCSGDPLSLQMMMKKLEVYESVSGQLTNKTKSSFLVHPKANPSFVADVKCITNFRRENFPFMYLGAPIYLGRKLVSHFSCMVDKVAKKISGWQNRLLSFGGRAVLIQAVLNAIPLHIFSVVQPPKTTLNQIDTLLANFFWGKLEGKNKYHWMAWSRLCQPVEHGGAGFKTLQSYCDKFAAKNWWSFRTKQSLLRTFLEGKYCQRAHPVKKKWVHGQSHIWQRLTKLRKLCEPHIMWVIGAGRVSFWWDNWLGGGALADMVQGGNKSRRLMVHDFITDGNWNQQRLRQLIPEQLVQLVLRTDIRNGQLDQFVWTLNSNGFFSCRSAGSLFLKAKNVTLTSRMTWHKHLPFKVSFFLMRLLGGKLPTDDVVLRFGNTTQSRCFCCRSRTSETINHLFVQSEVANQVWTFFCNSFGIAVPTSNIREAVLKWWLIKPRNSVQQTALQCLPSIISWEIWKARCKFKYEGERTSVFRICSQVWFLIKIMLQKEFKKIAIPGTWDLFCRLAERAKPALEIKIVRWLKPLPGFLKLNTDGCSKGNPGSGGCGGTLRDQDGSLVMAYYSGMSSVSNNVAECQAVLKGIRWCVQNGFLKVLVESDSLNTIKMVKRELKPPWQIVHLIEEIRLLSRAGDFEFHHCFREANMAADLMANLGEQNQQEKFFTSALTLPSQVKAVLKSDRKGTPQFRIRPKKGQFFVDVND